VLTRHFNDLALRQLNELGKCVELLFPAFSYLSMPPMANRSLGRTQTATTDQFFWPVKNRISSSVQPATRSPKGSGKRTTQIAVSQVLRETGGRSNFRESVLKIGLQIWTASVFAGRDLRE